MGVQTVTILVQSVIILIALGFGGWAWRLAGRWRDSWESEHEIADVARTANSSLVDQLTDATASNARLREQLAQIPLQEKPKRVDNPLKQARTSGDVRRLTEKAWGVKPDERN